MSCQPKRGGGIGSSGAQRPSRSCSRPTRGRRTPARKSGRPWWRSAIGRVVAARAAAKWGRGGCLWLLRGAHQFLPIDLNPLPIGAAALQGAVHLLSSGSTALWLFCPHYDRVACLRSPGRRAGIVIQHRLRPHFSALPSLLRAWPGGSWAPSSQGGVHPEGGVAVAGTGARLQPRHGGARLQLVCQPAQGRGLSAQVGHGHVQRAATWPRPRPRPRPHTPCSQLPRPAHIRPLPQ